MKSPELLLAELADKYNLDKIGFTHNLIIDKPVITDSNSSYSWKIDQRFHNPRLSVPWAKSMVVGVLSYYQNLKRDPAAFQGNVAMYTTGNYYDLIRRKLLSIAKKFKQNTGYQVSKIYVNGPFNEKEYARRAGLGYLTLNSLLVDDQLGSFTVIGLFLTDAVLGNSEIIQKYCHRCRNCESNCPTGALQSGLIDRSRCIQELSQQDLIIPDPIKQQWGNRFYGCDECQLHCPLNQEIVPRNHKPLRGAVGEQVNLRELIGLAPDQIKFKFKGNQMGAGWVSPFALIRNALLVLAHQKVRLAKAELVKLRQYSNPGIIDALEWYGNNISG